MELQIWQRVRHQFPARIAGVESGKLAAALVVLIVPGGLMLPLCYAAYAAVANSAARKSASARLNGSTDVPAAPARRFANPIDPAHDRRGPGRASLRSYLQL
jgi:hypothetical protein